MIYSQDTISHRTLDAFITRKSDNKVHSDLQVVPGISDHSAITCHLHLQKPQHTVRTSVLRNIKAIDRLLFARNVQLCDIQPAFSDSVGTVVNRYNLTLGNLLDTHAPAKTASQSVSTHNGTITKLP